MPKIGFLAALAVGLVVGTSTVLGGSLAFAAAGPSPQPAGGSVGAAACAPVSGDWTDCSLTLQQSVGAGNEVAASLPSTDGSVEYCDDGVPFDTACGLSGNTAFFSCPDGCASGTQFDFSIREIPEDTKADIAQQISVVSGVSPSEPGFASAPGAD